MDRKWWTLITVCTATFMLLLDITVVNVALPSIQRRCISFSDLQWVVDAYSLTLAAFLLTAGVVGDMFGRREVFAVGLGVFSLVLTRLRLPPLAHVESVPRSPGHRRGHHVRHLAGPHRPGLPGKERGTAFGIYGAVIGGAVAVGRLSVGPSPAVSAGGGSSSSTCRSAPPPSCSPCPRWTSPGTRTPADRLDRLHQLLGRAVYAGLRVGAGQDAGWGSRQILVLLIGSAVLWPSSSRPSGARRDPMLDLSLFRRPAMVGISLATFTIAASIFAMFLYLTLYIQDDLGYGPFAAGLRFLPIIVSFFAAPLAGSSGRVHARYLMGPGLLLVAIGCLLSGDRTHADSGWTVLVPGPVAGVGVGIANPVLASSSVAVVPPRAQRHGVGIVEHVSPGGHRHRHRRSGRGLPEPDQLQTPSTPCRRAPTGPFDPGPRGAKARHLSSVVAGGDIRTAALALSPVRGHRPNDALIDAYKVGFTTHLQSPDASIALVVSLVGGGGVVLPGAPA